MVVRPGNCWRASRRRPMLQHMDAEVPHPTHPSTRIGVLTLNLWGTNGPVHERLDVLTHYLDATHPDVVALQEVRFLDGRSQSELIADACGYPSRHYDRSWGSGDDEEGLAVLSRHPLTPLPSIPLPGRDRDVPRQLQRVELQIDGRTLLLANTHLAFRRRHGRLRLQQVRRILEVLPAGDHDADGADGTHGADGEGSTHGADGADGTHGTHGTRGESDQNHQNGQTGQTGQTARSASRPMILVGDLNASAWSRAVRRLLAPLPRGGGLRDAHAAAAGRSRATFSLANPFANQYWLLGRRIDHVLVSPGLRVVEARRVLTGTDAPVASDHYGVRADLVIPSVPR